MDIPKARLPLGKWAGVILFEDNRRQLWIPSGLAHCFLVLSEVANLEYKCTDYYDPADEGVLLWSYPAVNIQWLLEGSLFFRKRIGWEYCSKLCKSEQINTPVGQGIRTLLVKAGGRFLQEASSVLSSSTQMVAIQYNVWFLEAKGL